MCDERKQSFPTVHAFFVGGAGDQVTASNTLLKIRTSDGKVRYIMIDAGAAQGDEEFRNLEYPILGEKIEAVILTHSHYDHVGDLAMLYRHGFRGKVYSTNVAKGLIHTMLLDGAAIADRNKYAVKRDEKMMDCLRKRLEKKRQTATNVRDIKQLDKVIEQLNETDFEPLFSFDDVEGVMELFAEAKLFQEFEILDGIFLKFIPTTHQNGAIKVEVIIKDPNGETYTMFFSGDIGPSDSLMYENKYKLEDEPVDCAIMESLHGTSEPVETLSVSIRRMYEILKRGIKQKKTIVLVGFSLDRNAMLVKLMNDFNRSSGMSVDVLVDSPLTMVQLGNYQRNYAEGSVWFKDMGKEPFDVSKFKVLTSYRRHIEEVINGTGPRVVITASANGNGGRVIDYFENGIQRDDYVFVFCGWINPKSPSSILHEAEKGALVELPTGRYKKRCKTYRLHGFTSHGYYPDFKAYLGELSGVTTVVLNHARYIDKLDIKDRLAEDYTGEILIPKIYQAYEFFKGGSRKLSPDDCQMEFDEIFNIMNMPDLADETEITREYLAELETAEEDDDLADEVE